LSARLLISCAEASGDLYAGALTRALRAIDPSISVAGLGGPQFAAAGGRLIDDYRDIAVTGLTEAIAKIPRSLAALRRLIAAARTERPDALVVIDSPDLNFRLAPQVKRLGIPVIYYISPQIWAWRPGRLKSIRAFADRVLVIFPFEEAIYRDGGVPVEFVGHPLVDLIAPRTPRGAFLTAHGLSPAAPTIAILPGSRANEVARILPDLVAAASHIARELPDAQFVVARAPHLPDRLFDAVPPKTREMTTGTAAPLFAIVAGDTDTVLAAADVALTASGTATVQTALHDVPMVIVYRLSPLTYRLGRRLVTVKAIGMVNLIADRKIVPELVQDAFTPEAVAREAISMLTDRARAARIRADLANVRARLGGPGASRRAAEAILRVVHTHKGHHHDEPALERRARPS
jgi:lipid-A-disaccharide synthase